MDGILPIVPCSPQQDVAAPEQEEDPARSESRTHSRVTPSTSTDCSSGVRSKAFIDGIAAQVACEIRGDLHSMHTGLVDDLASKVAIQIKEDLQKILEAIRWTGDHLHEKIDRLVGSSGPETPILDAMQKEPSLKDRKASKKSPKSPKKLLWESIENCDLKFVPQRSPSIADSETTFQQKYSGSGSPKTTTIRAMRTLDSMEARIGEALINSSVNRTPKISPKEKKRQEWESNQTRPDEKEASRTYRQLKRPAKIQTKQEPENPRLSRRTLTRMEASIADKLFVKYDLGKGSPGATPRSQARSNEFTPKRNLNESPKQDALSMTSSRKGESRSDQLFGQLGEDGFQREVSGRSYATRLDIEEFSRQITGQSREVEDMQVQLLSTKATSGHVSQSQAVADQEQDAQTIKNGRRASHSSEPPGSAVVPTESNTVHQNADKDVSPIPWMQRFNSWNSCPENGSGLKASVRMAALRIKEMARSSRSASPARKKEALQSLDIAKQEQEHSVPLQEKTPEKYSVYLPEQPVSSFSSPCTSPKVVDSGQEWGVSQSMPVTPSAIERRNSKDYGRHSSPKGSAGADDALRSKLQENGGVMSLKTFRHMYEEQLAQDCGIVSEPRHSISSVSGVFLGENSFELTSSEINSLQSPEEPVNRLLGTLAAPLWLSITGIMPYTKHGTCLLRNIHFKCVAFAVLLGVCFYVYELVDLVLETDAEGNNERPFCEGRPCMQAWLICDLTLALGALVGLFAVQKLKRSNLLGACDALLVAYANNQGLLERWWSLSRVELIAMLALWICMVFERLRSMIANMDDGYCLLLPGVHVVIFACVSCLLMAISYCLLHVCCVLEVVIDSFGISVVECSEFGEAVRRWNVLQAVIRRASASVAFAYLVLLTSAMIAFVGPLMQSYRYAAIPAAFASLAVARFSLRAGAISYKCDRVPSLINSLSFGQDIDYERQYVVEYIIHSSAGFYIFEVRITVEMVLKFAYFSSALTLAVITKMISP